MKHLKRYNSLIFESETKNISDNDIKERAEKVFAYIRKNPEEKTGKLSELEEIMEGLWRDKWLGEENSDAYQIWHAAYQGFTKENMKALIKGVKTKLAEYEADKIIEDAKEFLQKNPTYKDFLLQSLKSISNI